jgi:hypothetical protein
MSYIKKKDRESLALMLKALRGACQEAIDGGWNPESPTGKKILGGMALYVERIAEVLNIPLPESEVIE